MGWNGRVLGIVGLHLLFLILVGMFLEPGIDQVCFEHLLVGDEVL